MASKENRKVFFEVEKELGVLVEERYGSVKVAKVGRWNRGEQNKGEIGLDLRVWYGEEGSGEFSPGKGIFLPLSSLQIILKEKMIEEAIKLIKK